MWRIMPRMCASVCDGPKVRVRLILRYTDDTRSTGIITLGAHAQRGYGMSVCLSGLYLAGRAFIRSTNDATYLAGNEVENICAILSETSPLQSWSPTGIVQLISAAAIFPRLGMRMRTIFFECELLFSLPIMPPSKVCQAIVPIRLKQDRDVRHIHNHIQFHLHKPSLACISYILSNKKKIPSNYCQACACCKFEQQLFVAQPSSLLYYISSAICAEGLHFSAFIRVSDR